MRKKSELCYRHAQKSADGINYTKMKQCLGKQGEAWNRQLVSVLITKCSVTAKWPVWAWAIDVSMAAVLVKGWLRMWTCLLTLTGSPERLFEFLRCYILRGLKKVSDSLELELKATVYLKHGFWEPNDCSTIAVYVLRPWAISPAPRLEDLLMSYAFNFRTLKVEARVSVSSRTARTTSRNCLKNALWVYLKKKRSHLLS